MRQRRGFERRLLEDWAPGIHWLEGLLHAGSEAAEEVLREVSEEADDSPGRIALFLIHARGVQVAEEVITLLRAGLASGAHARWRTLHELTVTAELLAGHGDEVSQRYLDHLDIDRAKAARQYQRFHKRLKEPRIKAADLREIEAARAALLERYGPEFDDEYGWANPLLKGRVTFARLEELCRLEHLRPWYRLASSAVHAGPKGVLFNLGNPWEFPFLMAGSSNAGLDDPGAATAWSLSHLHAILLARFPSYERLVMMHTLIAMSGRAIEEFGRARGVIEQKMEDDIEFMATAALRENGLAAPRRARRNSQRVKRR